MEISDKQIDDIFGDSPFMARESWVSGRDYEVVEAKNADWREVITNDEPEHHGYFDTYEKAETVRRRLHVRWVFSQYNKLLCHFVIFFFGAGCQTLLA